MAIKKNKADIIFDIFNSGFMLLIIFVCIYPLLYVLFASFSDSYRLSIHQGIIFFPLGFNIKGYEMVFENPAIRTGYINTFIILILGTALNLLMTSLGAYVLSRKKIKWVKYLMMIIVFTMFFSGGIIPFYLLVNNLGMYNTRSALIIPVAINSFNLIILRTSFISLPDSIEESAKIEGANDITILFRIIVPLSSAVMAVMALYYGVAHWNAWFNAMIFLNKRELFPLQLILREILILNTTQSMSMTMDSSDSFNDINRILIQYCTIIVATVPILFIYPFLQRYFVKGVMIGSIKG